MGYALWLVPSDDEANNLKDLMKYRPAHSNLPHRTRSYPAFHPHLTLATFDALPPNFQLRDVVPQAGRVKSYFQDLKTGNTYLGALSVHVSNTTDLKRLHQNVLAGLNAQRVRWRSRDFPHMSLFYVDEAPERERLQRGMRDLVCRGEDGRLILWTGIGRSARPLRRFTGSSVWLVDCRSKDVDQWRRLDRISLSPPRSLPAPRGGRDSRGHVEIQYSRREAYLASHHQARPQGGDAGHRSIRTGPHLYPRPSALPGTARCHAIPVMDDYLNGMSRGYYIPANTWL